MRYNNFDLGVTQINIYAGQLEQFSTSTGTLYIPRHGEYIRTNFEKQFLGIDKYINQKMLFFCCLVAKCILLELIGNLFSQAVRSYIMAKPISSFLPITNFNF